MSSSYNGIIGSTSRNGTTVSQTLGSTARIILNVSDAVPMKWFKHGLFSMTLTQGVSGGIGATIIGFVGGASTVIAGVSAGTAVGSKIMGTTGSASFGFPRPAYIIIEPVAGVAGFTVSFGLAGWY
jgi:hypothetical protein